MRSGRINSSSLLIFVYIIVASPQIFARTCESPFVLMTYQSFINSVQALNSQKIDEGFSIDPVLLIEEFNSGIPALVESATDQELYFLLSDQFDSWVRENGYLPGMDNNFKFNTLDSFIRLIVLAGDGRFQNLYYDIFSQSIGSFEANDNLLRDVVGSNPLSSRYVDFIHQAIEVKFTSILLEAFKRRFRDGNWTYFVDSEVESSYLESSHKILGEHPTMTMDILY